MGQGIKSEGFLGRTVERSYFKLGHAAETSSTRHAAAPFHAVKACFKERSPTLPKREFGVWHPGHVYRTTERLCLVAKHQTVATRYINFFDGGMRRVIKIRVVSKVVWTLRTPGGALHITAVGEPEKSSSGSKNTVKAKLCEILQNASIDCRTNTTKLWLRRTRQESISGSGFTVT